jgi:iron complex transport system permease protein
MSWKRRLIDASARNRLRRAHRRATDRAGLTDRQPLALVATSLVVLALAVVSLFVGVSDISPVELLSGSPQGHVHRILLVARIPRTLALLLSGTAMAVAGLIMQMLAQNRFVEPSTAGTVQSASLGMLAATLLAPGLPVFAKMVIATLFALAGTGFFLLILRRIPLRSALIVPLVGIMFGGIVDAVTHFFAYRYQLMQSVAAWTNGDFSTVIEGRYELLWLAFALTILATFAADRFTLAGMGESFAANLGLNYRRVVLFGLVIVAMVTAVVVATVGVIPFLGLVIPNLVRMVLGDNVRRIVPWVALTGAATVLLCDITGRVIRAPYEIPVGTIMGVVGSAIFLAILISRRDRLA